MKELKIGDRVSFESCVIMSATTQAWENCSSMIGYGELKTISPTPGRYYTVKTGYGNTYKCTRRQLRKLKKKEQRTWWMSCSVCCRCIEKDEYHQKCSLKTTRNCIRVREVK